MYYRIITVHLVFSAININRVLFHIIIKHEDFEAKNIENLRNLNYQIPCVCEQIALRKKISEKRACCTSTSAVVLNNYYNNKCKYYTL